MALGQIAKMVTIEVPADKAEHLKVISNVSTNALKIIADASKKPGMESKLIAAKMLGQI